MKLPIFSFIDEVLEYKDSLRFEIASAKKELDAMFSTMFQENDCFINYSSRVKTDESLKEKIIRQHLHKNVENYEEIFDIVSDIIGLRLECRFISDEKILYEDLFHHFQEKKSDGYYSSNRDPRVELDLSTHQPLGQKNGHLSYRIDGRFLGNRVLNFELQIKSIVNVFWNEIDHRILYKNYNYVLTESFVRQIMDSIHSDLGNIDKQLEMVYDHLQSLDPKEGMSVVDQVRRILGGIMQDRYLIPLREEEGIMVDFRKALDLITEYLFAKVQYESRETFTSEFIRVLDAMEEGAPPMERIGEWIHFDPPIHYQSEEVKILGEAIENEMNKDLVWNMMIWILIEVSDEEARKAFISFVDYLYFRLVKMVRSAYLEAGINYEDQNLPCMGTVELLLKRLCQDLTTDHLSHKQLAFWKAGLKDIYLENIGADRKLLLEKTAEWLKLPLEEEVEYENYS